MNIASEAHTEKIDKRGVAILTGKLNENDYFECHFNSGEKIPNSDGYFIIYDEEKKPFKRFDVQVKSTKKIKILKNGAASFSMDTKFINYASTGVTEDRCIIFHIDVINCEIYYKFLTSDFLDKNDFSDTDEKSIRIHFESKITDLQLFYKELFAFALRKKLLI